MGSDTTGIVVLGLAVLLAVVAGVWLFGKPTGDTRQRLRGLRPGVNPELGGVEVPPPPPPPLEPQPYLEVVRVSPELAGQPGAPQVGQRMPLTHPGLIICRLPRGVRDDDPTPRWIFNEQYTSALHFRILVPSPTGIRVPCAIIDEVPSTNGTSIGEREIDPQRKIFLRDGDEIRFGNDNALRFVGTEADASEELLVDKSGRIRFKKQLAEGGMSLVHNADLVQSIPVLAHPDGRFFPHELARRNAELKRSDLRLAVKTARKQDPDGADEQIVREAQMLGALMHPNVVWTVCWGELTRPGRHYLAYELAPSGTLYNLISNVGVQPPEMIRKVSNSNRFVLSERVVLRLGAQLVEALRYVHSRGIIHADMKPENILLAANTIDVKEVLLDPNLRLIVTDFGISIPTSAPEAPEFHSPFYVSPEHFAGDNLTPASDTFAVGAILYEMLAGEKAVPPTDPKATHLNLERVRRLHDVSDMVSTDLADLVMRMLDEQPQRRPHLDEVAEFIANALSETP